MKLLMAQNEDGGKRKNAARRREMETAQKRIGELSGIFKRLYEGSVSGRITDKRFMELSADYEPEQATLKARITELQIELGQAQEATVNVEKFMAIVRKYTIFLPSLCFFIRSEQSRKAANASSVQPPGLLV